MQMSMPGDRDAQIERFKQSVTAADQFVKSTAEMKSPGAIGLSSTIKDLKSTNMEAYAGLGKILRTQGNDQVLSDLAARRPDIIKAHIADFADPPDGGAALVEKMKQEAKNTPSPSSQPRSAAPGQPLNVAAAEASLPESRNKRVNDAVGALNAVGHKETARQLAEGAPNVPTGVATTLAMGVAGNPRGATSFLGSLAPELKSGEMGGMFRMAGMASIMQMLPALMSMIAGMGSNMMGTLKQSQGLAVMSSSLNSTMSADLRAAAGVSGDVKVSGIAPDSGTVQALGAGQQPSVQQQNRLQAVPGMSGPSPSPSGMG